MKPFTTLTATMASLPLADIDTDLIIPAQHLTGTSKTGYGAHLFERLRLEDATLFLHQKKYATAKILVTGPNFGCGSSREHAVWALLDAGFRVIIAESFADIFFSNSAKNGLLLVELPREVISTLQSEAMANNCVVTVNLEEQTVILSNGTTHQFPYDQFRKDCLMHGYDDLEYILANREKIAAYKHAAKTRTFSSTLQRNFSSETLPKKT